MLLFRPILLENTSEGLQQYWVTCSQNRANYHSISLDGTNIPLVLFYNCQQIKEDHTKAKKFLKMLISCTQCFLVMELHQQSRPHKTLPTETCLLSVGDRSGLQIGHFSLDRSDSPCTTFFLVLHCLVGKTDGLSRDGN